MLRVSRIVGIVAFAMLIGVSAHWLTQMYKAGSLFERYNNQRRVDVTLLVVSLIGLCSLSSFEIKHLRKPSSPNGFFGRQHDEWKSKVRIAENTSSIYTAPTVVDEWKGKRARQGDLNNRKPVRNMPEIWMSFLSVVILVMLVTYVTIYAVLSVQHSVQSLLIVPSAFSVLTLITLITIFGLSRRKMWGLQLGYLLAVVNLVVFPIGTVFGLLLLIGLVGSSPLFHHGASKKSMRVRVRSAA